MIESTSPMTLAQVTLGIGPDQYFKAHGKLLLSGEYFVLDGARSLGVPCQFGQNLAIKYAPSFNPKLTWKAYLHDGSLWFEVQFEFWRFNIISANPPSEALYVQKLLRQARKQNPHFLREEIDVEAISTVDFPLNWGLGSSSTLVYLIAQWAYTRPFELQFKALGGSGADVACAQAMGPIIYEKSPSGPSWSSCPFNPPFLDQLLFVHLGSKRKTSEAIEQYRAGLKHIDDKEFLKAKERVGEISTLMASTGDLLQFMLLMKEHETLVSKVLGRMPIQEERFSDFKGQIKSLGAWGGDFILAASSMPLEEMKRYFMARGHDTCITPKELLRFDQTMEGYPHGYLH